MILLLFAALLVAAYIVFRKIVRRDYLTKGGLTWLSSLLQLLIFVALMSIPYLYNPLAWSWFWKRDGAQEASLDAARSHFQVSIYYDQVPGTLTPRM